MAAGASKCASGHAVPVPWRLWTDNDAVFANVDVRPNLRRAHNGASFNDHRLANIHGDKVEGGGAVKGRGWGMVGHKLAIWRVRRGC